MIFDAEQTEYLRGNFFWKNVGGKVSPDVFCLFCTVTTDGKCGLNPEIAAIPPPPFDARLN
jgi:hypothetical protein